MRLRHRRAGDRQDLARHPLRARSRRRGASAARHLRRPLDPAAARPDSRPRRQRLGGARGGARGRRARRTRSSALLIAELELPPRPTVLVLEDVHWADEATLDAITVVGRRIGSLPALLVLTFRGGEAPPGHPLRATVGAIRADDSVVARARAAVGERGRLARRRRRGRGVRGDRRAIRSTSPSCSPPDAPPSCRRSVANAVLGRASRLDDDARRLVELVSVVPNRVEHVGAGRGDARAGPRRRRSRSAGSCSRSTPRYVRFRHELARNAIRSSLPIAARRRLHAEILEALLAADADPADIVHHAEAAGAEDVVAEYALVAARRAAALESNREAYSHYRRASTFVDRLPAPEQAAVLEELATAAYLVGRLDDAFPAIERAIAIYARPGRRGGRRPLHARRCRAFHWYRRRRRRRAREGARGDRDPRAARRVGRARARLQRGLAARDARRGHRAGARLGGAGARARDPARRRAARARTRSSTSAAPRISLDYGADGGAARGARRRRRRRATGTRRRARSATSATSLLRWVRPERGAPVRAAGARLRRGARGAHASRPTPPR